MEKMSAQHNYETVTMTVTKKNVIKESFNLETLEKSYSDVV